MSPKMLDKFSISIALFLLLAGGDAFKVMLNDTVNKFYLDAGVSFVAKNLQENRSIFEINNGSWSWESSSPVANLTDKNCMDYFGIVRPNTAVDKISDMYLNFRACEEEFAININEFFFGFKAADTSVLGSNLTDFKLIVKPPKFDHFEVKKEWNFFCKEGVDLVVNMTCLMQDPSDAKAGCIEDPQLKYNVFALKLNGVTFATNSSNGGNEDRREGCPKGEYTSAAIGIGCIAAFWTIVLSIVSVFVARWLLKRKRNSRDG